MTSARHAAGRARAPARATRLLLVNPRYPESFWSFRWAVDEILPGKRAINPPLGLATLAALCPPGWEVSIVDENVEALPIDPDVDVVGVCGMGVQYARQCELLAHYRARGRHVVAGGSFASLCPERYAGVAHTVVAGEAERIWPRFCADYEAGEPRPLYHETGVVPLAESPTPRFDLLKLDRYSTATLQFSRGCPYVCEFCDIIVMFGRRPRTKAWPQVERELDALRAQGARNAFFVDDNLIGHRPAAKALLRELVAWQARHGKPLRFGTEVSINLAQDAELLSLMREAGFVWVFVGIESADPQTLRDTGKTQNTHGDVLTSIRTIYRHGIDVLGGFIVGFDNDTIATFDVQHRFIVESGIQAAMVGLLTALPKTPLHARLESEGRLRDAQHSDNTKLATNVVPKRMGYDEMIDGYRALYRRLLSDEGIAARIRNKLRHLEAPVYAGEYAVSQRFAIVARLFAKGIVPGGPRRVLRFLGTMPWRAPRKFPLVIVDWIAGLAMRDYALRHLQPAETTRAAVDRAAARLRRALEAPRFAGRAALSLRALDVRLSLSLDATAGRRYFNRLARRLDRLLRLRGTTVRLDFERLVAPEARHVERLLARLARHGDRVSVVASEALRATLAVDGSRFNVVLGNGEAATR